MAKTAAIAATPGRIAFPHARPAPRVHRRRQEDDNAETTRAIRGTTDSPLPPGT
ncbi:hypothetical protein VM636_19870 [Streptomyces sp. SCSIO 75703]|uniref:hypothetical protein n=1 Tax=unclassified Streptomyces TaxID=2593676 RepID=UPI000B09F139|nr:MULTISPECIES: hypothetical protein [unclassified Streptomyces]